ncbi:MAG TPA: carboxypeptidase-like regulatory domain-containing protein, partial [Bacteroidia bacterium]|nr:carboxypeptidase-like regulatory domain-containing protein [Bacteroidia bacterium]
MFHQKKNYVLLALLLVPFIGFSQYTIFGKVRNKKGDQTVQDATVYLKALTDTTHFSASTEKDGTYHFSELTPGKYLVSVTHQQFKNFADTINITTNKIYIIELNDTDEHANGAFVLIPSRTKGIMYGDTIVKLDDVIVSSTRPDRRSAMAYSTINKSEIKEQNLGQDLPYLLNQLP